MKAFLLKSALATLVVAAPLGTAFAASPHAVMPNQTHVNRTVTRDMQNGMRPGMQNGMRTGMAATDRAKAIEERIVAAEVNLQPVDTGGYADEAAAARAESGLMAVRKEVASAEHGGRLSAADYRSLTRQLRGVEDLIYRAQNG